MTIVHKGIRRKITDVLPDYGQAYYAQNWRFKRVGELGRRPGIGKSNMAQMAGPVQAMICGNLYFPYVVQVTGGSVDATLNPSAVWDDPIMDIPAGQVGQPAAPVITNVTTTPLSPSPWIVGLVSFQATVAYDGLSGPLIYFWSQTIGVASPVPIDQNSNPGIFDFDANCIPGLYEFSLGVATTDNPLLGDFMPGIPFEVV